MSRLTLAIVLILSCVALSNPVSAAPGDDPEGGTPELREQLAAASKGFLDAKAKLASSQRRQQELAGQLAEIEKRVTAQTATISELAGVAYRTGRLGPLTALLNSGSADGFLDRAATLSAVASNQDKQVRELLNSRAAATQAKAAVDREVAEQRRQLAIMDARKKQAEQALANAARQEAAPPSSDLPPSSSGGGSSGTSPGPGGCTVNDPTTDGCITERMLFAYNQARAAGFTRFASCHRDGGSGEHPKGKACDFAAQRSGFGGVATGGDKTYGDRLANYFIANADRLNVLYVIWFRRIWLPSSGWKAYSGAGGDPASDHTNHVHLSVT